MASKLASAYRKSAEITPTYDYLDYYIGRGYRNLYCLVTEDSGGYSYKLTDQQQISTFSKRFFQNSSANVYVSNDFEALFNTSAIIEGPVIISYTLRSSSGGASTGNAKFEFFHVRDGVATSLGDVVGPTTVLGGATQLNRLTTVFDFTRTSFAPGDTLRVTVSVQNTSGNAMGITVDSLDTGTEATTSRTIPLSLVMAIPFVISF